MSVVPFNRDQVARHYAMRHTRTDPDIQEVIYLPDDAPEREIRFIEVNSKLTDMTDDWLEPMDFGVDRDTDNFHTLFILDVTPDQWRRILDHELALPVGWSLENFVRYSK